MKKERIVTRKWGDRRKGKTDWARVDALTDEDIDKAIADDPDWAEFKDIDWSNAVLVIPAKKKAISLEGMEEDEFNFTGSILKSLNTLKDESEILLIKLQFILWS